jgi:outer membrane lipoprotein-sorting protein
MNRRLAHFEIACLFFLGIPPAYCQTAPPPKDPPAAEAKLPSAEELSEKCAKGSGGKEAWAKLQTMVMTGTVDIPTFNVSGTVEVVAKRPNKILRITTVADGQFVRKEAFDGQTGWASDPQQGLKPITGARLEQSKVEAVFDADLRLKEVYPDLNVTGRTKVGDRDVYTATAHEPGEKTITMYLDTQTGLRIAEDTEGPDENGIVVKTNLLFDDYRSVGDVQIPYRIRIHAPNVSLEIKIEDVKFNVPVDDAKFAMPSSNAAAGQSH